MMKTKVERIQYYTRKLAKWSIESNYSNMKMNRLKRLVQYKELMNTELER